MPVSPVSNSLVGSAVHSPSGMNREIIDSRGALVSPVQIQNNLKLKGMVMVNRKSM